jgi:hypothetical protein
MDMPLDMELVRKIMLIMVDGKLPKSLENAQNDNLWKKAKLFVQEKGGAISVTTLGQLLASLAKKHFGIE